MRAWQITVLVVASLLVAPVSLKPPELVIAEEESGGDRRSKRQTPSTCTGGYESVVNSTMCMTDSPNYIAGTAGLSADDIAVILETHNAYRSAVNPGASAMNKLYWDEELAMIAEKWAKQCYIGHEEDVLASRYVPAYEVTPGQNGGFGKYTWVGTIADWHSEVSLFKYGENPEDYLGPNEQVGHYTQVVHDRSTLIGCGYAECSAQYTRYYICNYLPGQTELPKPYVAGTPCSGCKGHCVNNLCDCGGKFCHNGGTLEMSSCTCQCQSPYSGPSCSTVVCDGIGCENGGILDVSSCTCDCPEPYAGPSCSRTNCPARDPFYCTSVWNREYCGKFDNVPGRCPYMCGLC